MTATIDLVEQRHALGGPALRDQRPALNVAGERHQIEVAEPIADLGGLTGDRVARLGRLPRRVLKRVRHEQVAPLHAVALAVVEQPPRPGEPAGAAGELAAG